MRKHQQEMCWALFKVTGKPEYYLKWKELRKES